MFLAGGVCFARSIVMYAVRGAIQVEEDTGAALDAAVRQLCAEILRRNRLKPAALVSAIFTLTPDLHAGFPARVARELGWTEVPMICTQEIDVRGSLPRVCRLLLHVEGRAPARHVYLAGAEALRPDIVQAQAKPLRRPRPTRRKKR
jgi:chorismate mutase